MTYAEYLEQDIEDAHFCISVFDVEDGEVADSSDDYRHLKGRSETQMQTRDGKWVDVPR